MFATWLLKLPSFFLLPTGERKWVAMGSLDFVQESSIWPSFLPQMGERERAYTSKGHRTVGLALNEDFIGPCAHL
jgi:hypothetical protein